MSNVSLHSERAGVRSQTAWNQARDQMAGAQTRAAEKWGEASGVQAFGSASGIARAVQAPQQCSQEPREPFREQWQVGLPVTARAWTERGLACGRKCHCLDSPVQGLQSQHLSFFCSIALSRRPASTRDCQHHTAPLQEVYFG